MNGTLIHGLNRTRRRRRKNNATFILKTPKRLMMYFPIDDVVRVTLVMMVLKEKWAYRDSTGKLEIWAEREKQVWKTNLTGHIYECD